MSSVKSEIIDQPVQQYISTQPFNNDIFSYTVTTNTTTLAVTGTLSANITGATAVTCPAGRILRDSGLRLYPGVNPGVNTYMIGVIDNQTLIAGYIDPNSPIYAVYSTQIPVFYANGVDPGPQGLPDQGPPVYTNGLVYALETITTNSFINAGTSINAGTHIDVSGMLYDNTGLVSAAGQNRVNLVSYIPASGSLNVTGQTINVDCGASQVIRINMTSASAGQTLTLNAINVKAGAQVYLTISNNNGGGGNSISVVFGNQFWEQPNGNLTAAANAAYTFLFVSDGTQFWEIGRTANNGA